MKAPTRVPSHDPALSPFVTASLEEICHAEELRRQIRQQYTADPDQPNNSNSYWCVGAD